MKILFVGTGEAFDENRANVSLLIDEFLLLDCGYSSVRNIWKMKLAEKIQAIFVSHFHADHVGGLPLLLMRMRQEKRKKPVLLIGGKGFERKFLKFFDYCYKGFFRDLPFKVIFKEVRPGERIKLNGYTLKFAQGFHLKKQFNVRNLAVRVEKKSKSIVYSGDTIFSEEIVKLAKNCTLLVHEAYLPHYLEYHSKYRAHCSPLEAGRAAKLANAKILALVHVHRNYARKRGEILKEVRKEFKGKVILPKDGETIVV